MSTAAPNRQEANTALLRSMYQAFSDRDLPAAQSLLSENLVHHIQGSAWLSGDHTRDGLLAVFGEVFQMSGGTMDIELVTCAANDEYAFAVSKHRSERNGVPFETTVFFTARVEGQQIVESWELPWDSDALAAFYARD